LLEVGLIQRKIRRTNFLPETTKTLKQIIMQKTEQWHQSNTIHVVEDGVLVSKSQTNNFDKSPVYQIFIEATEEWLIQKRQEEYPNKCNCYGCREIRNEKINELLEELKE
jgi:hypothetical protein